jgi:hypothetical protein
MPVRQLNENAVVVGRFNPFIINPEWLVRQKICAAGEVRLQLDLKPAEQQGTVKFIIDGFEWDVTPTRLRIESGRTGRNPSELAVKVLVELRHTPLTGIGHNFVFLGKQSAWRVGRPKLGDLDWSALQSIGKPTQVACNATITCDGFTLTARMEDQGDEIQIHLNIHREIRSVEELQAAAERYAQDREYAFNCIRRLSNDSIFEAE